MKHDRQCRKCLNFKRKMDFDLQRNTLSLNRVCRECLDKGKQKYLTSPILRERHRQYYLKNKESYQKRRTDLRLKNKYGISTEIFDKMVEAQKNRCLLCENLFEKNPNKKPCVDHCHKTGEIRGILCRRCNLVLHYIENIDQELRKKALNYLGVKDVLDKELIR